MKLGQESSVDIGTALDDRGSILGRRRIVLFSIESRSALGPTQSPILSPGVQRPGREADYSLPCNVEVKNSGVINPLPNTPSWRGA
jgi:hypothetical protein